MLGNTLGTELGKVLGNELGKAVENLVGDARGGTVIETPVGEMGLLGLKCEGFEGLFGLEEGNLVTWTGFEGPFGSVPTAPDSKDYSALLVAAR